MLARARRAPPARAWSPRRRGRGWSASARGSGRTLDDPASGFVRLRLAALEPAARRAGAGRAALRAHTPSTIRTAAAAARRARARSRATGDAEVVDEFEQGLAGLAVPLHETAGSPRCSRSTSPPRGSTTRCATRALDGLRRAAQSLTGRERDDDLVVLEPDAVAPHAHPRRLGARAGAHVEVPLVPRAAQPVGRLVAHTRSPSLSTRCTSVPAEHSGAPRCGHASARPCSSPSTHTSPIRRPPDSTVPHLPRRGRGAAREAQRPHAGAGTGTPNSSAAVRKRIGSRHSPAACAASGRGRRSPSADSPSRTAACARDAAGAARRRAARGRRAPRAAAW